MKITLELTRSQLCDLALACTCAQFSAGDGGKKWKVLHDYLKAVREAHDSENKGGNKI